MEPAVERIDHVAIVVRDFDASVAGLTATLGLRCARIGRLGTDPTRRIAMIADATGFKLELIEAPLPDHAPPAATTPVRSSAEGAAVLHHVAVRVRDVPSAHSALLDAGYESRSAPRRIDAARADSALLLDPEGLAIQVIRYDADSPDI